MALTSDPEHPLRRIGSYEASSVFEDVALLVRSRVSVDEDWLLLWAPRQELYINGERVPDVGLRKLQDRDEIRLPGLGRFYFSSERLATVEPFPGLEWEILCPRCRIPIEADQLAVLCPVCRVWHHQFQGPDSDRRCWSYGSSCAACNSCFTDHLSTFRWSPEGL
ncbi:MAG: hypothetical protein V3T77_05390 [Planctomycetota bacterium]